MLKAWHIYLISLLVITFTIGSLTSLGIFVGTGHGPIPNAVSVLIDSAILGGIILLSYFGYKKHTKSKSIDALK